MTHATIEIKDSKMITLYFPIIGAPDTSVSFVFHNPTEDVLITLKEIARRWDHGGEEK